MDFNEAYEKANSRFEENGEQGVACCLDAQTHWVFYGGDPEVVTIGAVGLKIEKRTGAMDDFILPDPDNFELLDRAVNVDLGGVR